MSQGIQEWTVSGGSIRVFNTIEWIFLDDCNYVSHLTKIFFFSPWCLQAFNFGAQIKRGKNRYSATQIALE